MFVISNHYQNRFQKDHIDEENIESVCLEDAYNMARGSSQIVHPFR